MIRLTTNFQFNSELPLDYRMNFDTIHDLLAFPETDLPLGILSTVKANGVTYMFVGKDTANGGTSDGWKEVFRHGDFLVTASGIEYVNTNSQLTATTLQDAIDEVVANFNVYTENDSWRSAVDTIADLPPVGKAVSGEARVVGGNKVYVFDGTKWNDLIDSHVIDLATPTSDGLMAAGDKKKVDYLKVDGDGTKFLNDKGQYLTVDATIPQEDQNKLDAIDINGDGTKYFANNGEWKTMPSNATQVLDGFMSAADKVKVDMLQKTGSSDDYSKFLGADGSYHEVDTLSTNDRERLDKIQLNQGANKFLNGEGNYVSVIADLSQTDRDKIDAIHLSTTPGDEKKFLNEAGTYTLVIDTIDEATTAYHGLMSSGDKAKVDKIITGGDGTKVLGDDGAYHIVTGSVTDDEKAKIALLKSNGLGDKFLSDDGTYKEVATLNAGGDGTKVIADDGTYKSPIDMIQDVTITDHGLMLAADKVKVDKLIIDDPDGKKFLANDGEYKTVATLDAGGDGTKVIADDGSYKLPDEMISDVTTIKHGLMLAADKVKVDKLIIDDLDGNKFLANDGTYKEVTGKLSTDDQTKVDKIIITGDVGEFLAADGNYKNVTPYVDQVTTVADGLMLATDKVRFDEISGIITKNGQGNLYLSDDGTYKPLTATVSSIEATNVTYNNSSSGLTAENVQAAIDEIMSGIPLINDNATDSDTSALLSAAKIYTLLNTKAPTTHNHVVGDITDITTNYYDKPQVDKLIDQVKTGIMWQESVNTYTDIPLTYPSPQTGWLVSTLDTQQIYRYNGTTWEKFGSMAIQNLVTQSLDGLMSKEDKIKLDAIDENAPRIYYQSATPPLVNGNIWIEA